MSVSRQNRGAKIAIIGGGAAGFFAGITMREANSNARISIHEKGKQFLSKVRISGGGRCNVTHNCMDPKRLSEHYPRGHRELRAAFHIWQAQDTVDWFAVHGFRSMRKPMAACFPSQTILRVSLIAYWNKPKKGDRATLRSKPTSD